MRGLHKSKRVTWAPDVNLCQIKLFLSEESPAQVGLATQDHLQAKTSSVSHVNGVTVDDFLPPGFEGPNSPNQPHIDLSDIPVIKWRCPLRIELHLNWQVVAGKESKEVEIQNQRELRVLEAVYPRPSAIPTNPSVSADVENCNYGDHQTPLIPINAIEDEEAVIETPSEVLAPFTAPISSQPRFSVSGISPPHFRMPGGSSGLANEKSAAGMVPSVEPGIAAAAFAVINQSNEHGSMIDPDLLVKILSNPKLIEKLVTVYGAASGAQNSPQSSSPFVPLSDLPPPLNLCDPSVHMNRTENNVASLAVTTSGGAFYTQPNGVAVAVGTGVLAQNQHSPVPSARPVSPSPIVGLTPQKDVNYYKNLIQQHGGEKQGPAQKFNGRYNHNVRPNQELINNHKSRDTKPKIMKPCIYFNSTRGCRNGANCAYQHDTSSQSGVNDVPEAAAAKRMKLEREISS